jgi:hypothetical protein
MKTMKEAETLYISSKEGGTQMNSEENICS